MVKFTFLFKNALSNEQVYLSLSAWAFLICIQAEYDSADEVSEDCCNTMPILLGSQRKAQYP